MRLCADVRWPVNGEWTDESCTAVTCQAGERLDQLGADKTNLATYNIPHPQTPQRDLLGHQHKRAGRIWNSEQGILKGAELGIEEEQEQGLRLRQRPRPQPGVKGASWPTPCISHPVLLPASILRFGSFQPSGTSFNHPSIRYFPPHLTSVCRLPSRHSPRSCLTHLAWPTCPHIPSTSITSRTP